MASVAEERTAVDQLAALLRSATAVTARALQVHRGTPAGLALDRQLEHTLDRLALLYGRGTYENLGTADIVQAAAGNELLLATALDEPDATAATRRAQALVDAARRGVRLHVREPAPPGTPRRGVYVEPFSPELERSLRRRDESYLRWRDGTVTVLDEDEAAALRADGHEVDVLFLEPAELLGLDARGDRPAFEAELERRLAAARAAPDMVGDSREEYLLRLLDGQSIVLRNLRDRLADEHPAAHTALLPVIAEHRALLETRLAAAGPPVQPATPDRLGAAIDTERDVLAHVSRWSAEPGDPAGLRDRFRAVAEAGTRLPELQQHHAQEGTS